MASSVGLLYACYVRPPQSCIILFVSVYLILLISLITLRYWRNGVLVKDTSNPSAPRKVLALVEEDRTCISISALHFNSIDLYCKYITYPLPYLYLLIVFSRSIVEIFDSLVAEFGASCVPTIVCPHCSASNVYLFFHSALLCYCISMLF